MSSLRFLAVCSILIPCLGGCVAAGDDAAEEVDSAAEEMNGHNSLSLTALGMSALTANRSALAFLRSHSLQDAANGAATFPDYPDMRYQLHDPLAQQAMRYSASCALAPGQELVYSDLLPGGATSAFPGELGLCPSWLDSVPAQSCLELVSACVLARVNEVGARVSLSLRAPVAPLQLVASIPPEALYKDSESVTSLEPCTTRSYGVSRSCGFTPVAVGACAPGVSVTVGAGAGASGCASPLGWSSVDAMLRVCEGIYGCDPITPEPAASYAGVIAQNDDRCGVNPAVTFTCPASGFYSVMAGTYDSGAAQADLADPTKFTVQASSGTLAAAEAQVYKFLEGAFYGNVFDPDGLAPGVDYHVQPNGQIAGSYNLVVPTVFRNAFACYSPRWDDGAALLTSRLCAAPGASCLMQITGACANRYYGNATDPVNRCGTSNASGIGDYGACLNRDGTQRWSWPITTYLNDPCDTVTHPGSAPPSSCKRAQGATIP